VFQLSSGPTPTRQSLSCTWDSVTNEWLGYLDDHSKILQEKILQEKILLKI